jgi:hypothetical protein
MKHRIISLLYFSRRGMPFAGRNSASVPVRDRRRKESYNLAAPATATQPPSCSAQTRIGRSADCSQLWQLYLQSGFLYRAKIEKLSPHLEEVQETLVKLLSAGEKVCRIFIQERNGRISCSLATLRFYERTWLVHHMASLADPKGMRQVLLRTVGWMINSPEIGFGLFSWRSGNRPAEAMLGSIPRSLPKEGFGFSHRERSDYYFLDIDSLRPLLVNKAPGIEVCAAPLDRLPELSRALERKFGSFFCAVYALQPDQLRLDSLDRRYRPYGLARSRQMYVALHRGEPLAVALAENASLGMNFSFFLNKYQILPLEDHLAPRLRRQVTHKLLGALCDHYTRCGRQFLVGLCPESERSLYRKLGYAPLKQYESLAIDSSYDRAATWKHLDRYYATRLGCRDR